MKKLQLFALLMLLSTGYIAQAGQQQGQGGQQGSGKGKKYSQQQGKGKGSYQQGQNMHHPKKSQADIEAALGAPLSFAAVSEYTHSEAESIGALSASSTPAEVKAVMEQNMIISEAIMLLLPPQGMMKGGKQGPAASGSNQKNGNKGPRHGGMRNTTAPATSSQQSDDSQE